MVHSVSCTTRPMRKGDVDGRDYHFVDRAKFEGWIKNGDLAEWADVHDHLYGTPKKPLDNWLSEGRDVLLDVDVVGSMNLKKKYGDRAVAIFLLPPSMDELKRRLFDRGSDSQEQQKLRLENALTELAAKDKFDYQVVNDDLDRACSEVEKIIDRDNAA